MEIQRHWRLQKQRLALVGEVCPQCQAKIFPARGVCPECGGVAKAAFRFSGKGEAYSFTTQHSVPAGFEENAPYTVALVKLKEGPIITAQLTDVGDREVKIGTPVEMVTRRIRQDGDERGMLIYGYKFRPVLQA